MNPFSALGVIWALCALAFPEHKAPLAVMAVLCGMAGIVIGYAHLMGRRK